MPEDVEQDHHVALVFDQALGFLDDHFRDLHMAGGRLVESRTDHFAAHGALHVGDFFRPLVDQQHDQVDVRIVGGDRLCDVLHQHGLAGLGRRDDQAALALAERRDDVDDACGDVLGGAVAALHHEALVGEQRRQVFEVDLLLADFRRLVVDRIDLKQGEITLIVLGRADAAGDGVAGAQGKAADLAGRDVNVVRTGQVGTVRPAQEAVPVRHDLQHAFGVDVVAAARRGAQQLEHHILLARAGDVFQPHRFRRFQQLGGGLALEFGNMQNLRRLQRALLGGSALLFLDQDPVFANLRFATARWRRDGNPAIGLVGKLVVHHIDGGAARADVIAVVIAVIAVMVAVIVPVVSIIPVVTVVIGILGTATMLDHELWDWGEA